MLVMDWALNGRSVLEDMAICVSKCAPNVANRTGVKSGVSWTPDGASLIHLIHQEWSLIVTFVGKLLFCNGVICWSSSLCFDPTKIRFCSKWKTSISCLAQKFFCRPHKSAFEENASRSFCVIASDQGVPESNLHCHMMQCDCK